MASVPSTSIASCSATNDSIKQLKDSLRLELLPGDQAAKKQQNVASDIFSLLKAPNLCAADFEKFMSQAAATTTGTPTPSKFLCSTAETTLAQRQYAQGFIDALQHVQQLNGFIPTSGLLSSPSLVSSLLPGLAGSVNSDAKKMVSSPLKSPSRESFSVIMAMSNMGNLAYGFQPLASPLTYSAAQPPVVPSTSTVTSVSSTTKSDSVPSASESVKDNYFEMYPADSNNDGETCSSVRSNASAESQDELMLGSFSGDQYDAVDQERKKLERKRARNRMAATKCRQRKIQKISELEKLVHEETAVGNRKSQDLKALETAVEQLRRIINEHRSRGCAIPAATGK